LKRHVRIGAGAQADMAEASRWYDAQQSGLGLDFLRSIGRVIARIEAAPRTGSPVPGVPDADIRRVLVRRFPYHVVYIELPNRAQVLAIAHHRRRPRYWIGRVPR
jgi:plasmid stabilization system protein ParE